MGALKRSTLDELDADPGLYDEVLARMTAPAKDDPGGALQKPWEVCREMGLSYGALVAWVAQDETGTRMNQFRSVQAIRAHLLAEQALSIADSTEETQAAISKARLRTDVRRWLAKAYAPAVYGADTANNATANVTVILSPEDMRG